MTKKMDDTQIVNVYLNGDLFRAHPCKQGAYTAHPRVQGAYAS